MNEPEHLLACLAEECAEVTQRVTKAIRFGIAEVEPTQTLKNAHRIEMELYDLFAVWEMLAERGVLHRCYLVPHGQEGTEAISIKKQKVERFMKYARSIGALTEATSHRGSEKG